MSLLAQHGLMMRQGGGSAAHKAWRIAVTANHGYAGTQFAEIELRSSAGGADQTTPVGATAAAFATSTYSFYTVARAFDDNISTVWFTNIAPSSGSPRCVGYIFSSAVAINQVSLLPVPSGSVLSIGPKDFRIEWSDDTTTGLDGTWETEWSVSGEPAWSYDEARVYTRP